MVKVTLEVWDDPRFESCTSVYLEDNFGVSANKRVIEKEAKKILLDAIEKIKLI